MQELEKMTERRRTELKMTWLGVQSAHWTSEAALDDLERLIDRLHCAQKLTPWRV
jgi:hypothetical protein